MSSSEEEWTVVTSQDKRRVIHSGRYAVRRANDSTTITTDNVWTAETRDAVIKCMSTCQRSLVRTGFYQHLTAILERHEVNEIVCYGIGNLSASPSSAPMWQLACALAIRNAQVEEPPFLFYDPCTTPSEADLLTQEWKIQVLSDNEQGKRRAGSGLSTLFFMPHCPLLLYGNVLWANWNNLDRVLLFGNSLHLYNERALEKKKIIEHISLLLPFVKEERVNVSKRDSEQVVGNLEGAFNDCYLTWFSIDNETVLPPRPKLKLQYNDGEVI